MFAYEMPTKLYFGKGCIAANGDIMKTLGKKALLVTGRRSAKQNGAQDAVTAALKKAEIDWVLFDEVEENPSIATVRKGAAVGMEAQADFVIGIGGGSPMDAAKVIALLCTNELDDDALFKGPYRMPLPIVAVPTTSGTGSEVTGVSVLTNPTAGTKQSVKTPFIFPRISFADPSFTLSVSRAVTIDTAIDALSHAVEGYMSKASTPMSDVWAEEAMRFLGMHLTDLDKELSYAVREDLMYGATLAGIVIAQSGTTLVHGMGYSLTYYKGLSHGRANGLLLPYYMQLMEETMSDKTERVWDILGFSGWEDFAACIQELMPTALCLTEEEIQQFTALTMKTQSVVVTPYDITPEVVSTIYRHINR